MGLSKAGVTFVVSFEVGGAAVGGIAVGFDDQPVGGPEEVHFEACHAGVDQRLGQIVSATEGEEELLELAAGAGGAGDVGRKRSTERRSARAEIPNTMRSTSILERLPSI